ncbi:MAG: LacI family DNA-binding transcriptional regulator [Sphingomonadales bacterium]|nr:LacI family DNA-binding transcriptional regulator [Sphingomonadales bacterium]
MASQGDTTGSAKRSPRRSGRGPTVADVARLAGVSPMTVSRVVNAEARVTPKTRERVEAAIAELGYVPNLAARSLAGGRQFRIALLYANPSAAYLSEFLVGALAEADACDAQLQVEPCAEGEDAAALAARLARHRIDAVLLPPPLCDDSALIAALTAAGLPMAQVATGIPSPLAHAVTIDDEAAAHAVTARLIAAGHRRIGFIAGNPNQTASALRRAGHQRALAEAGIAADPALMAEGDFTFRSGLTAAATLLAAQPRPTAIFASNDDMAAAAMALAHRQGLDVPATLSICGFDDTALATATWPELTTVRQPVSDMARRATRLLVEALAQDSKDGHPRHERLAFTLIERESDGPPPA